MRLFFRGVGCFLFVLTLLCCAAFFCVLSRAPVFRGGERYTLYLGDSSSARAIQTDCPLLSKLQNDVRGESVLYEGDLYETLRDRFDATLLFTEDVCGIRNYYLGSPKIAGGITLNGQTVNLHIAVGNGYTAAGTPLIFGGF